MRKNILDKKIYLVFLVFITMLLQGSCVYSMEAHTGALETTSSDYQRIIVMATDDVYARYTAASIVSIKGSTPDSKSIIVLYNNLSNTNIEQFEKLVDPNTKIVVQRIDADILEQAQKFSTDWNILVQVRIFYQEIFNRLNRNADFLAKVGVNHIRYFIHLDSDTLILRNLFSIFDYVSQPFCFASANLQFVSLFRLEEYKRDVNAYGPSGGVVVWDLDEINRQSKNLLSVAQEIKAYRCLYNNTHTHRMLKMLCNAELRPAIIERIKQLIEETNIENKEGFIKGEIAKEPAQANEFFMHLSEIHQKLQETEPKTTLEEFLNYLIDITSDEEKRARIIDEINTEKGNNHNPTEEVVISKFAPRVYVPERYNFIVKNLFPETDATSLKDFKSWNMVDNRINSYTTLLREHLSRIPDIKREIVDEFNNIVVMHFDVCHKPWSLKFEELAKVNPVLNNIIFIYRLFEYGISKPDSSAEISKIALVILKMISPEEELGKVMPGNGI